MAEAANWRLTTDYIGAGRFVLNARDAIVGTDYGVQCVSHGDASRDGWKVDLGSRCIGVVPGDGDTVVAACVKGLYVLSLDGEQHWGTHTEKEVVYHAVPFRKGVLLTSRSALHYLHEWQGSAWRFDLRKVLGQSVRAVRLVNLFALEENVVVGAVDYDSGIGRVIVLDADGSALWMSDPGPLSELFPAGQAVFVWGLAGYGKFETHMTRLDGHSIWDLDFAGVGALRADGAIAMIVGSNESPEWDHWQYRQVSPTGKVEREIQAKGRSPVRPLCREDGSVFFIGTVAHTDPTSSRVDYTSFLAMPQEVIFQHLLGIRTQTREFDVYLQAVRPDADETELVYQSTGSYSLALPVSLGSRVVFADGRVLIGIEA